MRLYEGFNLLTPKATLQVSSFLAVSRKGRGAKEMEFEVVMGEKEFQRRLGFSIRING